MPPALAVRLPNWLGDTVMAVPAVTSLRRGLPGARLLLAGPWAWLLADQGLADAFVTYPRTWRGRLRAAAEVRRFGAEAALLLPNSVESALSAWCWGTGRRIGFASGGRGLLLTEEVSAPEPRLHQIDEYLLLVERCSVAAVAREPCLTPPPPGSPARGEARELLEAAGAPTRSAERRLIGVHLGAAYGPAKLWPVERVKQFCRLLDREGAAAVLLGAPADAGAAAEIAREAPGLSLAGRDRPELLPAVLAELDALVSGDTGVAHLAAALGRPVVTLFGPTDPRLTAPRGRVVTLGHAVPCAPCFYRTCPIDHPCLRGVEPGVVREQVWAMLDGGA